MAASSSSQLSIVLANGMSSGYSSSSGPPPTFLNLKSQVGLVSRCSSRHPGAIAITEGAQYKKIFPSLVSNPLFKHTGDLRVSRASVPFPALCREGSEFESLLLHLRLVLTFNSSPNEGPFMTERCTVVSLPGTVSNPKIVFSAVKVDLVPGRVN